MSKIPRLQPSLCQVLTAWVREPDGPEFLLGLYDRIELAQAKRSAHDLVEQGKYDYCIEPWVIDGRYEEIEEKDHE